jgi:environmental stress-induced protein Ves
MSDVPEIVRLPRADYRRMRWKNGAGWTTEIAQAPADDGGFVWRVSIAEVDADGDFSAFPGVDRSLLVLAGEGMALGFDDRAPALLRPLGEALAFPGEAAVRARLLGGPTRDFNVMTRRDLYTHTLALRRPGEALVLARAPGRAGWCTCSPARPRGCRRATASWCPAARTPRWRSRARRPW